MAKTNWLLWGGLAIGAVVLMKRGKEKKAVKEVVAAKQAEEIVKGAQSSQGDYIRIGY